MASATGAQTDYIISLYNQIHGTTHGYLSQCDKLQLSQREKKGGAIGGMTKAEASGYIGKLKTAAVRKARRNA